MNFYKYLFTLIFILIYTDFSAIAQDSCQSSGWPTPTEVPGLLFYIQRDPNPNTVCYVVNTLPDGSINERQPVNIFWINYAGGGEKRDLDSIQRDFAYGLTFMVNDSGGFILRSVSLPNRPLHLKKMDGKYIVMTTISGSLCVLKRVFIRILGGTALSPDLDYIDFYGYNPKTGRSACERLNLR